MLSASCRSSVGHVDRRFCLAANAVLLTRMQSAALPYRSNAAGKLEVLLVTSRTRRRWILPKGKVAAGMPPHRSAAREAMEEAGVVGDPENSPIGEYSAPKRDAAGSSHEVRVRVFALAVISELQRWPEDHHRERRWLPIKKALALVDDPGIRKVLKRFASRHTAT